ncbi:Protein C25F9.2 protein, partial [Aphelenchoides avenae]
ITNPNDGYCMLYAVELTRLHKPLKKPGGMTSLEFHKILKKGVNWNGTRGFKSKLPTMTGLVEKLFAACPTLPRGLPSYSVEEHLPLIQETYNRLYPGQYRIIAFDEFGRYQPCYKGPPAQQDICIVHHGNEADGRAHFDGVRCVNTLFGKSYYCPDCERAFAHKIEHTGKCVRKCRGCGGFGAEYPCRGGLKIECNDCNGTFVSRECYERHVGRMCQRFHKCKDCGVSYDTNATKRLTLNKKHECGQKFCMHCNNYHRTDQPCYIQPVEPKDAVKPYRIVAYDFECSQHTRPDPEKEWYLHEVNFVCAQVTCSQCVDWTGLDWTGLECDWKDLSKKDCKICGAMKEVTWSQAEGKNPLKEFVSWVLYSFDKAYPTYAFAHYGGRYDMQLVVNEVLRMGGLEPEVVRTGHKLYEVKIEKKGVVVQTYFRDSYCLMSQPLGDLVDAYKLGIEEKQFFPHLFNKPANYTRRLRHLPKRKYYVPDSMKPEKREQFKKWYREHKNTPFYLPDKLREYCCNDVQILLHALVAFRQEWMEVCQDDVLRNSMTIASACMRTYRIHHLQPETLALSPEHGYERHQNQSVIALKYLKWFAKCNGFNVRHRDSPGGEYKLECTDSSGKERHFYLDGYVERSDQRPMAIEFHG